MSFRFQVGVERQLLALGTAVAHLDAAVLQSVFSVVVHAIDGTTLLVANLYREIKTPFRSTHVVRRSVVVGCHLLFKSSKLFLSIRQDD